MKDQLIAVAIQELPSVLAYLRAAFRKDHPDATAPTDAEVIAAYETAFASSLARDEQWLSSHPATT